MSFNIKANDRSPSFDVTLEAPAGTPVRAVASGVVTFAGRSGQYGNHIEIEHACEKSCACTTCHVIVREGFATLTPSTEDEDDLLDRAWGLTPQSRLSCQAIVDDEDLVVEIPKYTINYASERH